MTFYIVTIMHEISSKSQGKGGLTSMHLFSKMVTSL